MCVCVFVSSCPGHHLERKGLGSTVGLDAAVSGFVPTHTQYLRVNHEVDPLDSRNHTMIWATPGTYGVAVLRGLVYSYRVELPTDEFFGLIWLQDRTTHEQWYVLLEAGRRVTLAGGWRH